MLAATWGQLFKILLIIVDYQKCKSFFGTTCFNKSGITTINYNINIKITK